MQESTNRHDSLCPCASGLSLAACCGPYLEGKCRPATAVALMRSRYTAYVQSDAAYLRQTWHIRSRPANLSLENDTTRWEGLSVLRCARGGETDETGEVEFIARYRQQGETRQLHEVSRFVREGDIWYYLDGRFKSQAAADPKPGRNTACPCGSGKKFKKCCGA